MLETLRTVFLAGLGALNLSEEKAKEFFNSLVQRGELTEKEAREFFAAWRDRVAEQRGRAEQSAYQAAERIVESLKLARRADIEALEARIAALEARLARSQTDRGAGA
jgi:poly(hydroxyalkanoate) granule-associated protein